MAEFTDDDDALLSALGVEVESKVSSTHTPREERMLAGFEEIQRFVDEHGHSPRHGEERDIFERLYAVRLDRLRQLPDALELLKPLDRQGLLTGGAPTALPPMDDDALLAELGVAPAGEALSELRHVRSAAEKRSAEDIADHTPCVDFDNFKPLFDRVKRDLKLGDRQIRPFHTRALDEIQKGAFFVVNGQTAYVAEVGEEFTTQYERRDSRLRVIYDNGTEANVLQRSLQRALHRDEAARFITDPVAGPLFSGTLTTEDVETGTIYVLRSLSEDPYVVAHRDVLHKIGVTGGKVETRIANAEREATYLLAAVEVVATYQLAGINRNKMEKLFHRLFENARLDVTIRDRFGNPVEPREWFLVPLFVINEAVDRIRDGSITNYVYDPKAAKLVKATRSADK